jgi:hypothetical protein
MTAIAGFSLSQRAAVGDLPLDDPAVAAQKGAALAEVLAKVRFDVDDTAVTASARVPVEAMVQASGVQSAG